MILVFTCVLFLIQAATAGPSSKCLACICSVESGNGGQSPGCGTHYGPSCNGMSGCNMDVGSCSCGPYQIKSPYFTDCKNYGPGVPNKNWAACTTNGACAKQCVINYMNRYGTHCTGKPSASITCADYAGIHNGGPNGCSSSGTTTYRQKVQACCNKSGGC